MDQGDYNKLNMILNCNMIIKVYDNVSNLDQAGNKLDKLDQDDFKVDQGDNKLHKYDS